MKNVIGVILAAGKGTRLNNGQPSDIPKVLRMIGERPLIDYCVKTLKDAGIDNVVVVVGYKGESVKQAVGNDVKYALQEKQLGTSHAVYKAKDLLKDKARYIVVLNGDTPFFSKDTIRRLVEECRSRDVVLSMTTTEYSDPTGLGRIIKDNEGHVLEIIEEKEATKEQKKINEINCGLYCFNNKWLWNNIVDIDLSPHGEYYITDLIGLAVSEGEKVYALKIKDNREAIGVNTPEHLRHANKLAKEMDR